MATRQLSFPAVQYSFHGTYADKSGHNCVRISTHSVESVHQRGVSPKRF
jgi:hypothetical protein